MAHKKILIISLCCMAMLSSCQKGEHESPKSDYNNSFSNRKSVEVNIQSATPGQFYAVYYENPYDEQGNLIGEYALRGVTPIKETLDVPDHVEKFYVLTEGAMKVYNRGNLNIAPSRATRAINTVTPEVLNAINSIYLPESQYNFRNEDLYKCTDLVITQGSVVQEFDQAEVWITYLGNGGFGIGTNPLPGKLWFYTYPTSKRANLTLADCTFYGRVGDQIKPIAFAPANARMVPNPIFASKDEMVSGAPSFQKLYLGTFPKGLSIGFAFFGNAYMEYTTPNLNTALTATVNYGGGKKFTYTNAKLANGFIQHLTIGDFEGNVLGMENRAPGTSAYDGDYNDMICLIESNPLRIEPEDPVTPPDVKPGKVTEGIYIFEDNYPYKGDYDFNDAVIQYRIVDYYQSSNKQKEIVLSLLACGAGYNNTFGYYNSTTSQFVPLISGISGYKNVFNGRGGFQDTGVHTTTVLFGDIKPYLHNGSHYIFEETINDNIYPYFLEIPLSATSYKWCAEFKSIDQAYPKYLLWRQGLLPGGVWYTDCNEELVFQR